MGKQVVVFELPDCDICADGTKAKYDAKTRRGPWGNLCEPCWKRHTYRHLGTGFGQELVLKVTDGSDHLRNVRAVLDMLGDKS